MSAYTPADITDMTIAPIILKAIPAEAYQMPTPSHADHQVNPAGATFAAVADLPSFGDDDVREWVARYDAPGVLIMACFARGMETAADLASGEFKVTCSEMSAIRAAAKRELVAHLAPLGYRTDHLA